MVLTTPDTPGRMAGRERLPLRTRTRKKGRNRAGPRPGHPGPAAPLKILVPAYFFPAGAGLEDWDRLIEAAAQVSIIAIVNPDSGPGEKPNPDYADVVTRAKKAGVEVIGYVNTGYGQRPRPEIEADIDRWIQFYPDIRGYSSTHRPGAEHVDLYVALRAFCGRRSRMPS